MDCEMMRVCAACTVCDADSLFVWLGRGHIRLEYRVVRSGMVAGITQSTSHSASFRVRPRTGDPTPDSVSIGSLPSEFLTNTDGCGN